MSKVKRIETVKVKLAAMIFPEFRLKDAEFDVPKSAVDGGAICEWFAEHLCCQVVLRDGKLRKEIAEVPINGQSTTLKFQSIEGVE